jgi:hypothetical protein
VNLISLVNEYQFDSKKIISNRIIKQNERTIPFAQRDSHSIIYRQINIGCNFGFVGNKSSRRATGYKSVGRKQSQLYTFGY